METKLLTDEIYDLCLELKLYENLNNSDFIKNNIEKKLDDVDFVESLYNIIFLRAIRL